MSLRVEIHPHLMEEAVRLEIRGRHAVQHDFDAGRAALYGIADPEIRERSFARFFARWFAQLELDRPIGTVLSEAANELRAVERCLVGAAPTVRQMGAELFVSGPRDRTIVISMLPASLIDRAGSVLFLRREITHISDMLDPLFLYEAHLPVQEAGPAHDRLVQDRYRVLWATSIDARLFARAQIGEEARALRRSEFRRLFDCLAPHTDRCFERLFTHRRPTHPEMVARAVDPELAFGLRRDKPRRAHRCPLCSFPTIDLVHPGEGDELLRAVGADFSGWHPRHGLCRQCADLYRARADTTETARRPGNVLVGDPSR